MADPEWKRGLQSTIFMTTPTNVDGAILSLSSPCHATPLLVFFKYDKQSLQTTADYSTVLALKCNVN